MSPWLISVRFRPAETVHGCTAAVTTLNFSIHVNRMPFLAIAMLGAWTILAPATLGSETTKPMAHLITKDGVKIAFDKTGNGPALLLIGGALSDRQGGKPLAAQLA